MNFKILITNAIFLAISITNLFAQKDPSADLYTLHSKIKNTLQAELKDRNISLKVLIAKLSKNNPMSTIEAILKATKQFVEIADPVHLKETINQIELICSMAGLEKSLISMMLKNKFETQNYQENILLQTLLTELTIIDEYISTVTNFVSKIFDKNNPNNFNKFERDKAAIFAKIEQLYAEINAKENLLKIKQKLIIQAKLEQELKIKNYQTRSEQTESNSQKDKNKKDDQPTTKSGKIRLLEEQCQKIQNELDQLINQTRKLEDEIISES